MFNIQGGELIFLLLIALVVLGPEKLPDAVRKFTKGYAEFKKMANGFQGELRQVLDEPMRELRDTADAVRDAAKFEFDPNDDGSSPKSVGGASDVSPGSATPQRREAGLNFGSANPRRQSRIARADEVGKTAVETTTPDAASPLSTQDPAAPLSTQGPTQDAAE